jgi:hypothetical protein
MILRITWVSTVNNITRIEVEIAAQKIVRRGKAGISRGFEKNNRG